MKKWEGINGVYKMFLELCEHQQEISSDNGGGCDSCPCYFDCAKGYYEKAQDELKELNKNN